MCTQSYSTRRRQRDGDALIRSIQGADAVDCGCKASTQYQHLPTHVFEPSVAKGGGEAFANICLRSRRVQHICRRRRRRLTRLFPPPRYQRTRSILITCVVVRDVYLPEYRSNVGLPVRPCPLEIKAKPTSHDQSWYQSGSELDWGRLVVVGRYVRPSFVTLSDDAKA